MGPKSASNTSVNSCHLQNVTTLVCPWYLKTYVLQFLPPLSICTQSPPSLDTADVHSLCSPKTWHVRSLTFRRSEEPGVGEGKPWIQAPPNRTSNSQLIKRLVFSQFHSPVSCDLAPSPWWPALVVFPWKPPSQRAEGQGHGEGAGTGWGSVPTDPVTHLHGHSQMERQKEAKRKPEKASS